MPDIRHRLQAKWDRDTFANFGNVIKSMHVQGLRSHTNTLIDFQNSVTAFCGFNGTGKSTLLQLAAVGFVSPDHGKGYIIPSFIKDNRLDVKPFTEDARIEYQYLQGKQTPQVLTISRGSSRWQGYQRRPARYVLIAGVSFYIPKIEQRDFIVRNMRNWTVAATIPAQHEVRTWISRILNYGYTNVDINTVNDGRSSGELVSLGRQSTIYSEAHMGYGEGRTSALIAQVETMPEKSLILVEEPEASLHPSAQYELGQYFVDVSFRRGHQIILTTHSEYILKALPSTSHVYLHRENDEIRPLYGLTSTEANSLLTAGHDKSMHLIVEDECAQAIVTEMIRKFDANFLMAVEISPVGKDGGIGVSQIKTAMQLLNRTGIVCAAVLDGDQTPKPSENMYVLPGTEPPEKELFKSERVREHFRSKYYIDMPDFLASLGGEDHHNWFKRLAHRICKDETAILYEAAEAYVGGLTESMIAELVRPLKESIV